MQRMKFSRLSLLSQREQRALQISFAPDKTVLVAGNGFGKSAILKSLYETLGANPHKIDNAWTSARVTSLLEFSIDGRQYAGIKLGKGYSIYDDKRVRLIHTTHVTKELGPFLADLLDFRLKLTDKKEEIKTPPPSYAFAPFYVDQDRSWQKGWDAFKDLGMFPSSSRSLAEYHSGMRPNAFYEAKANRDMIRGELLTIDAERNAIHQALQKVRESMAGAPIVLSLEAFSLDTDRLVAEGQALHTEQAQYRAELASLTEEHQVWSDHVALVQAALKEADDDFTGSLDQPADIECPLCGQHYQNHISDQFELVADKDELLLAYQTAKTHLNEVHDRIADHRKKIDRVQNAIDKVQQILAIKREDITLRDVVAAEGRTEAQRYLLERLAALDSEYGSKQRTMEESERQMKEVDSRQRKATIRAFFSERLQSFAKELDVRLPEPDDLNVQGLNIGRGSEGPRARAAYYFAFLHTVAKYGTATFCPIVVDAPNQQGQDQGHLQTIMKFLLSQVPQDAQLIMGAEIIFEETQAEVIDVSWKKDQVLREDAYAQTLDHIRPFLDQATR
jgi:hypothetical protein